MMAPRDSFCHPLSHADLAGTKFIIRVITSDRAVRAQGLLKSFLRDH